MSDRKDTLIILAQSLEQPRIVKRIIGKAQDYKYVQVFGFTRGIHAVGNYRNLEFYENIKVEIVGSLANNDYKNRIKAYIKLLIAIYRQFGLNHKNLYVFGLDLRILSIMLFNSSIHYEISDIMWLYKPKFQRLIFGNIDKLLTRFSKKVTFTSSGFYNQYYKNAISSSRIEIQENKFKTYNKVKPILNLKSDKITIAYIGAFRYVDIMKSLLEVVSNNKEIMLNFYGDGQKDIVDTLKSYSCKCDNIAYHGAFKNPDDLEKIYASNNLNFVVYDNTLDNEKVAMPNKYYESGYFNIPIVCAENTYVGDRVVEHKMGWAIETQIAEIESFITKLTLEDLKECHMRLKSMDKMLFSC